MRTASDVGINCPHRNEIEKRMSVQWPLLRCLYHNSHGASFRFQSSERLAVTIVVADCMYAREQQHLIHSLLSLVRSDEMIAEQLERTWR